MGRGGGWTEQISGRGVKLSDIEADVIFIVIVTLKWKQDEEHDIIS